VAGGVGEDPSALGRRLVVGFPTTDRQHDSLGLVDVRHAEMQMTCIEEAGSGQVGGRWPGERWNERWNSASALSPIEHQPSSATVTGHSVSRE
jgi:hypothetical protein